MSGGFVTLEEQKCPKQGLNLKTTEINIIDISSVTPVSQQLKESLFSKFYSKY
jgi:hypothetical protein